MTPGATINAFPTNPDSLLSSYAPTPPSMKTPAREITPKVDKMACQIQKAAVGPWLKALMRKMVKKKATLHRLMDADKNDQITLNEFMRGLAMSGIRPVPSDEQLMTLFESFDADSDMRISYHEMINKLEAAERQALADASTFKPRPRVKQQSEVPPIAIIQAAEIKSAVLTHRGCGKDAVQACRDTLARISGSQVCKTRLFRSALTSLGVKLSQRQYIYVCKKYDPYGKDELRSLNHKN